MMRQKVPAKPIYIEETPERSGPMYADESIRALVQKLEPYTISMRRQVHTFAEVAGKEYKTSELVCKALEALDIPYEKVTETAVIGVMDTGKPGPDRKSVV